MQSQKSPKALWMLLLPMPLLMVPSLADAATSSIGLDSIMTAFQSTTQGWYHAIFTDALGLFAMLFGVEFTWMVTTWLIGGKDVHEIFTSLVKKLISIAFFYTLLLSSAQIIPDVTNGFRSVAASANGAPVTTVSDIAMTGVRGFVTCVEGGPQAMSKDAHSFASNLWHLNLSAAAHSAGKFLQATADTVSGMGIIAGLITGFILLLSFIYVALELVAVQLESMIVLGAGVIMLGFGAARWTTGFVESYLKYALAVGVRLMVLTLWASFIEWQVNPLIHTTLVNGNASPEAYAIVIILALLVAWMTKKLPGFAGSILSGNSTLSGGEMFDAVKKGTIAAGMAVAALATGGAALAGAGAAGAMGAAEAAGAGAEGAGALSAAEGAGARAGAGSGAGGAAGSDAAGAETSATSVPAPSTSAAQPEEGVQPPKAASEIRSSRTSRAESGAFPQAATQDASAKSGTGTAQPGSQQQQQKEETTGAGAFSTPSGASASDTSTTAGDSGTTAGDTTGAPDGATSTSNAADAPPVEPAGSAATTAPADSAPSETPAVSGGSTQPAAPSSGTSGGGLNGTPDTTTGSTETASTNAASATEPPAQAPSPSEKPADPVDHRPSAPNAPSETPAGSGGTQPDAPSETPAGSGSDTQPAAPTAPSTTQGGETSGGGAPASDSQSSSGGLNDTLKSVKETHEALSEPSIGSHQDANVSAPSLGIGHIKD